MLRTGAIERVLAPLRGDVEVELDLCPVAMAAQTCHSLGLFDESHVAVQNFQRFCDVVMGGEREASAEKYPVLASLCETLQLRHGRSAAMLMHGAGRAGAKQNLSSREYAGRLNSGTFHPLTIRRRFPRSEMTTGEIAVHDLLNFMEAARAEPTTYMVSVNKRVCLCVTSMDGLAIRQGLSYDDQTKKVWGLNSGPFGIEKAEKLNAMDDEQLRRHFVDDPMASEINECMIATANNAVASNLFWSLKKNGGGATTIYDDISNGVPVIACFETLLQAHRTGGDIHRLPSSSTTFTFSVSVSWSFPSDPLSMQHP